MPVLYESLTENATVDSIMEMSNMLLENLKIYTSDLPDAPTLQKCRFDDAALSASILQSLQIIERVKSLTLALKDNTITIKDFHN